MRRSLKASLVFAAASLFVGGFATADCPEWSSAFQTVSITPNDTAGVVDGTGTNVYRFVNAFDVTLNIDLGTSATDADIVFTQFAVGGSTPQTGANERYTINGVSGEAAIPTTAAAITGDATSLNTAVDTFLTFRNVQLSPVGCEPTCAGTGDLGAASERTITFYMVADAPVCALDGLIDITSFNVISQATGPDALTAPSCVWTPVQDHPTFNNAFSYGAAAGGFASIPGTLDAGGSFGQGMAPSGTASIGINKTDQAGGFAVWGTNLTANLSADTLYRVSGTMSTTATLNSSDWIRQRFGGLLGLDHGGTEQGFEANASALPTTARAVAFFHWAKSASAGASAVGSLTDAPTYFFDYIDNNNASSLHSATLDSLTIESTTRDCLSGETVVRNFGVASVSNADDFTPPAGAPTGFSLADNWITLATGSATTVSGAPNANAYNVVFATGSGAALGFGLTGIDLALNPTDGLFAAANNKVYALDLWLSTTTAPNNTTTRLPVLRTRFAVNEIANSQREILLTNWTLQPDASYGADTVNNENNSGITAANSAKHYASFFSPNLNTTAQPITDYTWNIDWVYNRQGATECRPVGTIVMERLMINSYDQPTF